MFQRIQQAIYAEPWAITPDGHRTMVESWEAYRAGKLEVPKSEKAILKEYAADPRYASIVRRGGLDHRVEWYRRVGSVALIEVTGVLGRKLSAFDVWCGGACMSRLIHAMELARDDASIETIALLFDSPGGTSSGTGETARVIRKINGQKDVIGFTETMAASAAQELLAACGASYAGSGARVGSVGTYLFWLDHTRSLIESGIDPVVIWSGKHKAVGVPGRPLSEEDFDRMQDRVTGEHERFRAAIREFRGRPGIPDEAMEGQVLWGFEAEGLGMIDGLVDSFSEFLDLLEVPEAARERVLDMGA